MSCLLKMFIEDNDAQVPRDLEKNKYIESKTSLMMSRIRCVGWKEGGGVIFLFCVLLGLRNLGQRDLLF